MSRSPIAGDPLDDPLEAFETALGYRFGERKRLENALQHSSFAHDHQGVESNERLEFLGDSVIGLVVAHALFAARPEWSEGELTRALHALVEGRSLARLARSIGLGGVLRLGRTERQSGGEEKDSILADAMEAVVGAMYLDGGLETVEAFVERFFPDALAADAPAVARDPKTELQERAMAARGEFPTYRLTRDSEVEGDDERFSVEAWLCGEVLADGIGRTKRAAERMAADRALASWVDDTQNGAPGDTDREA
jgi:ribonuclease III